MTTRPSTVGTVEDPVCEPRRLRIMVCPHELVTGGSQLIAIDLARRLRDRGHEVVVYGPGGTLVDRIHASGMTYRPAPPYRGDSVRPTVVRSFLRVLRQFRPDVVHTYESGPALALTVASLLAPVRHVATVGSMTVPDFIADDVPLLPGTGQLVRAEERRRPGPVHLMPVTVDTALDAPRDVAAARERLGLGDGLVVSVVGRLSAEHGKALGVASAIDALATAGVDATFIVAGAGDDEHRVAAAARRATRSRLRVRLEGNVADPGDIYAAADVVLGMGSSAARAMAYGKPVVVQGCRGFWRLLEASSAGLFEETGFFGDGPSGGPPLAELVRNLAADPEWRARLGAYSRQLVLERYSATTATNRLEALYLAEADRRAVRRPAAVARAVGRYARFRLALAAPWLRRAVHRITPRDA
ncbi:glycosyltransferase family 4 protein [Georgenia deserti]|uniref:D-inositol 3-phosphate glycosyltransferase n=1 Tax=Georgenia deserti TaxID=2093781 RepID=A0ABW4L9Y2_9MICO